MRPYHARCRSRGRKSADVDPDSSGLTGHPQPIDRTPSANRRTQHHTERNNTMTTTAALAHARADIHAAEVLLAEDATPGQREHAGYYLDDAQGMLAAA